MKPARIILLILAISAGGLAAFFASRGNDPEVQKAETIVVQEDRLKVLVARKPIGVGDRLSSELLKWQEWPKDIVRPEFITDEMAPDAREELSGTVARFVFFEGEPIRQSKLARSEQGYLSAIIEPGKRAVSIAITAESGAGGFIVPNDRVDVVLTSATKLGDRSETILQNVKVLIIDSRFGNAADTDGNSKNKAFDKKTIAVLELDPDQSETIVNASEIGQLALVLRSVADFGEQASDYGFQSANAEIRLVRFGKEKNIISGNGRESSLIARETQDSGYAEPPVTFDPATQEYNTEEEYNIDYEPSVSNSQ